MIKEPVLATISQFYPKAISGSQDNRKYHNSEEIKNHKATLNQIYNFEHKRWKKFLGDLAEIGIVVFDFSTIPSNNSCFQAQIRRQDYVIVLLISAFRPSYNILAINVTGAYFLLR